MILLLDTNVISAIIRREMDPVVAAWFDRQVEAQLHTSVIAIHELRFGIERMPAGRRRTTLAQALGRFLELGFHSRILELDYRSAMASASIQARRESIGRPINLADCLMAGIALDKGARLVTRDVDDFQATGIDLINPWQRA
jgi:hypothetical protein